jgi:hypothetical protein
MQVCGRGDGVLGDGIVPVESALLEGAHHVVLDGVFHSMSKVGTFDEASGTLHCCLTNMSANLQSALAVMQRSVHLCATRACLAPRCQR